MFIYHYISAMVLKHIMLFLPNFHSGPLKVGIVLIPIL